MKAPNLALLIMLFFTVSAMAQSANTSRTKRRIHSRVDSVSTWGVTKDTAAAVRDSLRRK